MFHSSLLGLIDTLLGRVAITEAPHSPRSSVGHVPMVPLPRLDRLVISIPYIAIIPRPHPQSEDERLLELLALERGSKSEKGKGNGNGLSSLRIIGLTLSPDCLALLRTSISLVEYFAPRIERHPPQSTIVPRLFPSHPVA